jgi:glycerol-3-phosphate dehydrogenase
MSGIDYDLCVIGGGINGAGIARDAAGRGLKVLLLEAEDLGGATSSASTKLIHGGLRYLEYFEFKLVRESLKERELLLSLAPHVIWPMKFVLPHTPEQRPAWMVRIGLFLYDHLAKRERLSGSSGVNLTNDTLGASLKNIYGRGFSYADCWADDSRVVVLNAMSAAQKGATVLTRHRCVKLQHDQDCWHVSYQGKDKRKSAETVKASMVVNAAGPWVQKLLDDSGLAKDESGLPKVRLVKGSHIIVKRQYKGDHAYILQQPDRRITFAIPYEKDYTLIGTTEENYDGDPREAMISDGEMSYLVEAYNRFFEKPISKRDVMWTYSGVRPLYDDGGEDATSATRDYKLHMHLGYVAPMISVFGGKLTTYRKLAEAAVNKILHLGDRNAAPWTGGDDVRHVLPGGDIPDGDFDVFLAVQGQRYKWLPKALLYRYCRSYGTCMDVFLRDAQKLQDLGKGFSGGFYEAELLYLLRYEYAQTAEDVLWRRSKLGLHVSDDVAPKIEAYIKTYMKDKKT